VHVHVQYTEYSTNSTVYVARSHWSDEVALVDRREMGTPVSLLPVAQVARRVQKCRIQESRVQTAGCRRISGATARERAALTLGA
jgi:hypothetical protein